MFKSLTTIKLICSAVLSNVHGMFLLNYFFIDPLLLNRIRFHYMVGLHDIGKITDIFFSFLPT